MLSIRPKASDAPHEGLLKVERREFRCLGFRVLVFRCLGRLSERHYLTCDIASGTVVTVDRTQSQRQHTHSTHTRPGLS